MPDENFGRTYVLKAGPMKKKGFEIGNTTGELSQDVLHISFSVEKADTETANTAKVQIWNLSPQNLAILEKEKTIIELKAGYKSWMPLILVGSVTSVVTELDNADRMTEIDVVDGYIQLRDTVINISKKKRIGSKALYQLIAQKTGMDIMFGEKLKFKTYPRGFSYIGKASGALDKLKKFNKHAWTIQNEVIQITNPGHPLKYTKAFKLTPETGLLGYVKKITQASKEKEEENKSGYEIQYFLNGVIGVNDVVVLDGHEVTGKPVKGKFRVQKISMEGDNFDGDWICTAEVVKIKDKKKKKSSGNATLTSSNSKGKIESKS